MTRALFCSVFVLTVACGSSSSDDSGAAKGGSSGNTAGSSAGGSHAGTGNSSAGTSSATGGTSASTGGTTGSAGAGTGTAGSGTAGAGTGTAGSGGSGGTTTADGSVTQWGGDIARTGHWVNASLTQANAAKIALDTFTAPAGNTDYAGKFAGEVAALPLYLAGKSGAAGEYIAVTTQNDVYAFDETTGALVWKHNIGVFRDAAGQCGTPAHHGIISTPVIDATTRTIYVVGGMAAKNNHELHALNADTGMEVAGGWPVDLSTIKANGGTLTMESDVQNQRSALSLVGGVVYVAFGGYCGDQGNYHGWVTGVKASDPTQAGAWATLDRQAGIWAAAGLPSDGTGVFAVTGNSGASGDHTNSDSEEIIRVTGLGTATRDAKDMFYPTAEWATPMNSNDLDFGSSSPTVVAVPGSTPANVLVAPAKPGRVYFVDPTNLGASLGQFADMAVAATTAASVYTSPTAYTSTSGVHAALVTGQGSQCPSPVGMNDGSVMSIVFTPGAPPMPKMAWCAKIGTDGSTIHRSPISTSSSSANADPIVWVMNGSKLNGFDGETGNVVFDGGTGTCAGVHAFTSLIVANGHIIAAGDAAGQAHLCSWSVHN